MKPCKVSIAIATYNGGQFLREQLDSLYIQSRKPDEVVVADDCSTDDTQAILEEYHQKKGLKYIVNDTTLGVNRNFEKAIRNCTGNYIAICDQDDVWMPHKIQTCLSKLQEIENDEPACVSSQGIGVDRNLRETGNNHKVLSDSSGLKANLMGMHISQGCTMMMNRKLVEKLKEFPQKEFMYDAYIGLLAACIGNKYNISEPLMYYRHHDSNVIGRVRKHVPLLPRIVNHIGIWKYNIPFDSIRFRCLSQLLDMHEEDMKSEARELIRDLLNFFGGGAFYKVKFILKEDSFNTVTKIRFVSRILATALLPVALPRNDIDM